MADSSINPSSEQAIQAAKHWAKQGRDQKAIEHYEIALNQIPDHPNHMDTITNILLEMAQHHRALGQYKQSSASLNRLLAVQEKHQASSVHPDIAFCHAQLGLLFESLIKKKQAIHHYKKAQEILEKLHGPNNSQTQKITQKLNTLLSQQ